MLAFTESVREMQGSLVGFMIFNVVAILRRTSATVHSTTSIFNSLASLLIIIIIIIIILEKASFIRNQEEQTEQARKPEHSNHSKERKNPQDDQAIWSKPFTAPCFARKSAAAAAYYNLN